MCAGKQDRFWALHDLLFANQRRLDGSTLRLRAGTVGVDLDRWQACRASEEAMAEVTEQGQEAVSLTPSNR